MPKGIPLTDEDQSVKRHEIFDAAVSLFLEKGFPETSMREIAEAAGMGKSSLYDYFRTKDEILLFIIEEETLMLTHRISGTASLSLSACERISMMMHLHLDFLKENTGLFVKLSYEAQRLKPASRNRINGLRHDFQDTVKSVIDEGIANGEFRNVDSLLTARLLINSLITVLYTTRPTGNTDEMLAETVKVFFNGILAR